MSSNQKDKQTPKSDNLSINIERDERKEEKRREKKRKEEKRREKKRKEEKRREKI